MKITTMEKRKITLSLRQLTDNEGAVLRIDGKRSVWVAFAAMARKNVPMSASAIPTEQTRRYFQVASRLPWLR